MTDELRRELANAASSLQALAGTFARAGEELQRPTDAVDSSESVTVSIDPAGRVTFVRPHSKWLERAGATGIGAAVYEAVQTAWMVRVERWAEVLAETDETAGTDEGQLDQRVTDDRQSASVNTLQGVDGAVPAGTSDREAADLDLFGMVGEVSDWLGNIGRRGGAETGADTGAEAESDEGADSDDSIGTPRVRVLLGTDGGVRDVQVDPQWAAGMDRGSLAEQLTDAFRVAYEEFDERSDESAGRDRPGAELPPAMAAVAANPVGVLNNFTDRLRRSSWPEGG